VLSLLAIAAVVVGAVVLKQIPTWPEIFGLALVSGAIAMTATAR
jgi:inner membrane transporter RhtA